MHNKLHASSSPVLAGPHAPRACPEQAEQSCPERWGGSDVGQSNESGQLRRPNEDRHGPPPPG
eukprot:scaffold644_cov353-Prasinococcus_capsulatus_cf.AAC.10